MDKRKAYSIAAIKQAFLKLYDKMPSEKISVSALCREAGISRTTFYAAYPTVYDVLIDIIDDIFYQAENPFACHNIIAAPNIDKKQSPKGRVPFCEFVIENPAVQKILLDPEHHDIVIRRNVEGTVATSQELRRRTDMSEEEIREFLTFQVNGCMALIKDAIETHDKHWRKRRDMVDGMMKNTLKTRMKH